MPILSGWLSASAGVIPGAKDGAYRATFEDKPLLSDVVFLRAWVALDLPRFYNPVTNLLAPPPQLTRAPKHTRGRGASPPVEEPEGAGLGPSSAAAPGPPALAANGDSRAAGAPTYAEAPSTSGFQPSARFTGPRVGMVFKSGLQGLGYYPDLGPKAAVAAARAAQAAGGAAAGKAAAVGTADTPGNGASAAVDGAAGAAGAEGGSGGPGGWVGVRTVADLRRAMGTGAPRHTDSLYRPVERAPRKFNPLKVPKALQAALPFKTKPKLEPARKRKSLEQKRAVVLEPGAEVAACAWFIWAMCGRPAGRARLRTGSGR